MLTPHQTTPYRVADLALQHLRLTHAPEQAEAFQSLGEIDAVLDALESLSAAGATKSYLITRVYNRDGSRLAVSDMLGHRLGWLRRVEEQAAEEQVNAPEQATVSEAAQ